MLTSAQAFKIAHDAAKGRRCYEQPCSAVVDRAGDRFTVLFLDPVGKEPGAPAHKPLLEVDVDGKKSAVIEIREDNRSAYEIALAQIGGNEFDERGRTTIELEDDVYCVTFPLPAAVLAQTRRPDFAVQVFIDAENGTILRLLLAS